MFKSDQQPVVTYFELENIFDRALPYIKNSESSNSAHRILQKIIDILW
jgi:hypothetical protein